MANDRNRTLNVILDVTIKSLTNHNIASFANFAIKVSTSQVFILSDVDYLAQKIYEKNDLKLMF